ncbi:hypothetical protein G6O67_004531 [Ophiocordyceps sinensis]|uniref:Uncharacterized protein n=1 Tax=Ophiocordyceps sinensis TaxID=72228 RepID=A0A8H4PPL2_9HYPO|nr:hypothetical protein G6O67_004531 [Ophiocordyceps sinensis]
MKQRARGRGYTAWWRRTSLFLCSSSSVPLMPSSQEIVVMRLPSPLALPHPCRNADGIPRAISSDLTRAFWVLALSACVGPTDVAVKEGDGLFRLACLDHGISGLGQHDKKET